MVARVEVCAAHTPCFSGFAGLFPPAFAAVYWRGESTAGAVSAIVVTLLSWLFLFWLFLFWLFLFWRDMIAAKSPDEELLIYGMMPATVIFVL